MFYLLNLGGLWLKVVGVMNVIFGGEVIFVNGLFNVVFGIVDVVMVG